MANFALYAGLFVALLIALNFLSYRIMGGIIRNQREQWDLNICCGKTDGGGVNVDIVKHAEIPNLIVVDDIYNLPFTTNQFDNLLCSHTIEHVDDAGRFLAELHRVSKDDGLVLLSTPNAVVRSGSNPHNRSASMVLPDPGDPTSRRW